MKCVCFWNKLQLFAFPILRFLSFRFCLNSHIVGYALFPVSFLKCLNIIAYLSSHRAWDFELIEFKWLWLLFSFLEHHWWRCSFDCWRLSRVGIDRIIRVQSYPWRVPSIPCPSLPLFADTRGRILLPSHWYGLHWTSQGSI